MKSLVVDLLIAKSSALDVYQAKIKSDNRSILALVMAISHPEYG
jgi:hypothetical protein